MIDFTGACRRTANALTNVTDDQLGAATPCGDMRLADLVQHIGALALAFTAAGRKDFGPLTDTPPSMTDDLEEDWRTSFPARLAELAEAWDDPAAWQGMSRAGGVDFPADVGGLIALTEVVIHGWDLARASGQSYELDSATAEAVLPYVAQTAAEGPIEGMFGPAVPVADDAPLVDRIVALSGRDPQWRAH
jgi:uncharacterized protein (TIGR03086 family)